MDNLTCIFHPLIQDMISCIIASNRVKRSILQEVGITGATVRKENVQCFEKGSLDGSTRRLCKECFYTVTLPVQ